MRQDILRAAQAQPGISVGELMTQLDLSWGTFYHHLGKLEEARLLQTRVEGRRRLLYPTTPDADPALSHCHALLRGKTARRIAEALARSPGPTTIADLATLSDITPRVLYYHLQRLEAAGLVLTGSATRYQDLRASPLLLKVLGDLPAVGMAPAPAGPASPESDDKAGLSLSP